MSKESTSEVFFSFAMSGANSSAEEGNGPVGPLSPSHSRIWQRASPKVLRARRATRSNIFQVVPKSLSRARVLYSNAVLPNSLFFDSSVAGPKGGFKVSYAKTRYPVGRYIRCLAFFRDPVFWRRGTNIRRHEVSLWSASPSTIGQCDIRSMTRTAVSEVDDVSSAECSNASDIVLVLSIAAARLVSFRSQATAAAESARLMRPRTGTDMTRPNAPFASTAALRRRLEVEEKVETKIQNLDACTISFVQFVFIPDSGMRLSLSHRLEFDEQQSAEGKNASLRETGPADPRGRPVGSSSQAPAAIAGPASSPDASATARCGWSRAGLRQRQRRRIERADPPRQPTTIIVRLMARMKRLGRLYRTRSIDLWTSRRDTRLRAAYVMAGEIVSAHVPDAHRFLIRGGSRRSSEILAIMPVIEANPPNTTIRALSASTYK
ncbi:hypothetical protein DBV15_02043 [Temnothorax longispinosus]|uniref:Uncharacterized protein n=1 Tax=Temnothorax longispinosus TaxID=300112 RepID=A0A4S2KJ84_9HYME|nr:hypothetical protein DBV15_02043 [Temnothorax longispinosus]